jgi:hypothetical protein
MPVPEFSRYPSKVKGTFWAISGKYYCVQNLFVFHLPSKSVKIKIYRTIILPVVLYSCESWSLTLREECRLRVFENKVLRRIFGPKKDEVT